jgi:DNA polymerase I-like protein with 3'-5' exonuclease and polymerase domains
MRTYILPAKGKRWGRRDYNQQEVRLFGFFEEGPVHDGFIKDPRFDMHEGVRMETEAALIEAGLRDVFERDDAKTGVFGAFYGQGLAGLMEALKLREEDKAVAQIIHKALHRAAPSIKELSNQLKALSLDGQPIRTWGGRLYYVEPPMYVEKYGRNMTFEYKLISYLIQGSGADVIKEAIVRYDAHPKRQEDLNVTVYDELNVDLPLNDKGARQEMTVLRDCMQSVETDDIPMLSDGEVGPNWGKLEKYAI